MRTPKFFVAVVLSLTGFVGFAPTAQSNPFADGYHQRSNPFADGYVQDSNPFADGYVQDKSVFGFWVW